VSGSAPGYIAPVRTRSVTGLVVVLFVLAAGAPTAQAAPHGYKAIWGPVNDFPIYRNLGVQIYEMVLDWKAIAPTRPRHPTDPDDPAYRWPAEVQEAITEAAHYHMRVLLEVRLTPSWANGGRSLLYPPDHPSDYAAFITAAARRYPSVHLWMIWGEPDRKGDWASIVPAPPTARVLTAAQAAAPRLYARLLDASYGVLKEISPRNLVIGGNTYTTGDISTPMWIKYMRLPDGRPPRMDLYGHNPFSFRPPDLSNPPSPDDDYDFSDLARLERLVDRNLAPPHHTIPLFLSEWTIPTAPWDDDFNFWVDPSVQAQWITDAWRIVRSSSFIYGLGWIHLFDGPVGGSAGGLIYHDGTRKPGYYAFKAG
jgi:hypothetical protein